MLSRERNREQLVAEGQRQHENILQYFEDVDHWNRLNPGEKIDPDRYGDLCRILGRLSGNTYRELLCRAESAETELRSLRDMPPSY